MKWVALCVALAIAGAAMIQDSRAQDVEYCYDYRTYPPKVVIVPAGVLCPPGFQKG
jgi:hypothetical protein